MSPRAAIPRRERRSRYRPGGFVVAASSRSFAEGIRRVYERRESIKGLKFVYEPEKLRFFQGRFESK